MTVASIPEDEARKIIAWGHCGSTYTRGRPLGFGSGVSDEHGPATGEPWHPWSESTESRGARCSADRCRV